MSQSLGSCPLCGDTALLEYTSVTTEEMNRPDIRLADVACKNERCKNYVPSDRIDAARGNDPRQTWRRT
jgi:hypothetical protein